MRGADFVPSKTASLCSKHFRIEDLDRKSLICVCVREDVIPTVFGAFPQYLKCFKPSRKPRKPRPVPELHPSAVVPQVIPCEVSPCGHPSPQRAALKRKLQEREEQVAA